MPFQKGNKLGAQKKREGGGRPPNLPEVKNYKIESKNAFWKADVIGIIVNVFENKTSSMRDRIEACKLLKEWAYGKEVNVEAKITFEFVNLISEVFNRNVPDQCPHCKKDLALRERTVKELEEACKSFDVPQAA